MSKELFCAAVKDLLPSYIDGLTSPETNQAIAEHLLVCDDCKKRTAAMAADNKPVMEAPDKEVDYLKTVRRKARWKIVLGIGITLCVVLLAIFTKVYLIGWPVYSAAYSVSSTGGEIVIAGDIMDSAKTVRKVNIAKVGGNAYVTIYGCLPSFLTERTTDFYDRIPVEGVDKIYLGKADNAKEIMWIKGTSSSVEQTSLTGANVKVGELVLSDRGIIISNKYPPQISYSITWLPAEQTVDLYLVNADNGTKKCVASEHGGKSNGALDLKDIPDGTYYFALRNSGDKLERPDDKSVESILAQFRYVNYAEQ